MTEGDENLFFEKDEKACSAQPSPVVTDRRLLKLTLSAFGMFILAVGFGVLIGPVLTGELPSTVRPAANNDSIVALEDPRLAELENRLKLLEEKTVQPVESAQAPAADAQELLALKTGLVQIAESLGKLEAELSKTTQKTEQVGASAESGLAGALAYIQMHTAAFAGRPFENERQVMRTALAEDAQAQALLAKLEALAVNGAPTIEGLQNQFQPLALEAQTAIRKAAAKTWQDRIIVALESLVSIRKLGPVQGSEPLAIASVVLDLSKDKLQNVLDKIDAYPPEAREILKNWREQVVARLELERAFADLCSHLIGRFTPKPVEPVAQEQTP